MSKAHCVGVEADNEMLVTMVLHRNGDDLPTKEHFEKGIAGSIESE